MPKNKINNKCYHIGREFSSFKTELISQYDVTFRVSNSEISIKIKFSSFFILIKIFECY